MSRPDLKLAMILAKEKNSRRILELIQQIYFHGLMDGAGGNIVDPDERFIVIKSPHTGIVNVLRVDNGLN